MVLSIEEGTALAAEIEAAFSVGGDARVLQVMMPNGQPLGACSGEDLRQISEAYNKLARRGALAAAGLAARNFIDGVYVEMASVELGALALAEAGQDEDKARMILRRLLAADPTILRHLLDRVLEDEVRAAITALKARADARLPPGYEADAPAECTRAPSPVRDEALLMRVRAVLQESGEAATEVVAELRVEEEAQAAIEAPVEQPRGPALSHYALAARSALEEIFGRAGL